MQKQSKRWRGMVSRVLRWVRAATRLDKNAAELRDLVAEVREVREGMSTIQLVHGHSTLTGMNIGVLVYTQGGREHTRLFDFGTKNVGAILDLMERFEHAGVKVRKAEAGQTPLRPFKPAAGPRKAAPTHKPGKQR